MDPEVLVIGGGLIGLAIARELRSHGVSSLVLERGEPGREASWAGAGMLSPFAESFPDAFWREEAERALALYPQWVHALERESGVAIDFQICGTADSGRDRFLATEGCVDPRDLLRALLVNQAVERNSPVPAIRPVPGGIEAGGRRAKAAVIAAGAWSGEIESGETGPSTEPVRGHLLGYRMPPGSLGPTRRDGHTYILQRRNGWTIVGSTEERVGFRRDLDPAAIRDLAMRGEKLWPELAGRPHDEAWCGFRPSTPSGLPARGRDSSLPVWRAYGHFRNGILLAPAVAERTAREIISSL